MHTRNKEETIVQEKLHEMVNSLHGRKTGIFYRLFKRILDILISSVVLFFFWPVILYIYFFIKKRSAGGAIFKQMRIKQNRRDSLTPKYYCDGKSREYAKDRRNGGQGDKIQDRRLSEDGRYYYDRRMKTFQRCKRESDHLGQPFTFYKFRTMYSDARKKFPELYAYDYTEEEIKELKFKIEDDPRVPGWANWLRQSSLDEIPNFINVLLGDMSIVGPRPDIPEMMKYYSPGQKLKFNVKPGITGLAQIMGRGHLKFQDSLKYDVEYVLNQSMMLDLKIIMRTIMATMKRQGAF